MNSNPLTASEALWRDELDRRHMQEEYERLKKEVLYNKIYGGDTTTSTGLIFTTPPTLKEYEEMQMAKMDEANKPAFREKHYRIMARILVSSLQGINKAVHSQHHDAVHRAMAVVVERMIAELTKDNPRFKRKEFLKSIEDAQRTYVEENKT